MLHGDEVARPREIQEVEVESVAFIVLDALGLASDDYSFPYVARWSDGELERIKETGRESDRLRPRHPLGARIAISDKVSQPTPEEIS